MKSRLIHSIAAIAAALTFHCRAADSPAKNDHDYVRYVGDDWRGKLETAIIAMKNDAGVHVELIGAVHIADAAYYKILSELFRSYEVLLFELVDGQKLKDDVEGKPRPKLGAKKPSAKPSDTVPVDDTRETPAAAGSEPVAFTFLRGMMQGLGNYFHFQYQTDGIDYHSKNFVHADVSMKEFQRLQDEKGESFGTIFRKAIIAGLQRGRQKDEEPKGGQLLLALLGDSSGIKVTMARMLGKAETLGEMMGMGADSVILGERNRVALEIFDQQVKSGRKNLGIFYGAAHLPDMEKRLEARGYKRTEERWLTAWDIKPRADEKK